MPNSTTSRRPSSVSVVIDDHLLLGLLGSAEALAVRLLASSSLLVAIDSPPLRVGAAELGIEYQLER